MIDDNDITIEEAVGLLEAKGYHIVSDENCLSGGEDPEPSEFGDIQLIQKPFRIERNGNQWQISSKPIGQITTTKLFRTLRAAVDYVLARLHLRDPRTITTVKPSGPLMQILKGESAGIEPVFRGTYTRRVKK